jgi:hypothetical protein
MERANRLAGGQLVDAGKAPRHEPLAVEFPVLVAIAAEPVARVVVPLIGEAHCDAFAGESPELLEQTVVDFLRPLASQEGLDLFAADLEFGAIAPSRFFGAKARALFRPSLRTV